jgi:hypothetical protein
MGRGRSGLGKLPALVIGLCVVLSGCAPQSTPLNRPGNPGLHQTQGGSFPALNPSDRSGASGTIRHTPIRSFSYLLLF